MLVKTLFFNNFFIIFNYDNSYFPSDTTTKLCSLFCLVHFILNKYIFTIFYECIKKPILYLKIITGFDIECLISWQKYSFKSNHTRMSLFYCIITFVFCNRWNLWNRFFFFFSSSDFRKKIHFLWSEISKNTFLTKIHFIEI